MRIPVGSGARYWKVVSSVAQQNLTVDGPVDEPVDGKTLPSCGRRIFDRGLQVQRSFRARIERYVVGQVVVVGTHAWLFREGLWGECQGREEPTVRLAALFRRADV